MTAGKIQQFAYRGLNEHLVEVVGTVDAESIEMAKDRLSNQEIYVTKIQAKSKPLFNLTMQKQMQTKDVTVFSRQTATMLKSGLPLIQALDVAAQSSKPHVKRFMLSLRSQVASGIDLSETLRAYPKLFDRLYCDLVAAGEVSGNLDVMLDRIASFQEKNQRLKANIKKAMTYPVSVMLVASVVVTVLLVKVIPSFESTFNGLGSELPSFTLSVIVLSEFVQKSWANIVLSVLGSLIVGYLGVKKSPRIAYFFDGLLLRLPLIGQITYLGAVSRFARTLATTYGAGMPMLKALEASAGAAGNTFLIAKINAIKEQVSQGSLLTVALQNSGHFPPLLVQLSKVGEEAGDLEGMFNKAAETYEQMVEDSVDTMTSLLEPIIISFLAVVIGGILVAMYLPIFQIGSVV
jgi:type IV pilus assembly protein PilC